jgi:hypothetical protein
MSFFPPNLKCAQLTSLFMRRGVCLGANPKPMCTGYPGTSHVMFPLRAWLGLGHFCPPIHA